MNANFHPVQYTNGEHTTQPEPQHATVEAGQALLLNEQSLAEHPLMTADETDAFLGARLPMACSIDVPGYGMSHDRSKTVYILNLADVPVTDRSDGNGQEKVVPLHLGEHYGNASAGEWRLPANARYALVGSGWRTDFGPGRTNNTDYYRGRKQWTVIPDSGEALPFGEQTMDGTERHHFFSMEMHQPAEAFVAKVEDGALRFDVDKDNQPLEITYNGASSDALAAAEGDVPDGATEHSFLQIQPEAVEMATSEETALSALEIFQSPESFERALQNGTVSGELRTLQEAYVRANEAIEGNRYWRESVQPHLNMLGDTLPNMGRQAGLLVDDLTRIRDSIGVSLRGAIADNNMEQAAYIARQLSEPINQASDALRRLQTQAGDFDGMRGTFAQITQDWDAHRRSHAIKANGMSRLSEGELNTMLGNFRQAASEGKPLDEIVRDEIAKASILSAPGARWNTRVEVLDSITRLARQLSDSADFFGASSLAGAWQDLIPRVQANAVHDIQELGAVTTAAERVAGMVGDLQRIAAGMDAARR